MVFLNKGIRLDHYIKLTPLLVVFFAVIVIVGWIIGNTFLMNIKANYVPMMFETALLFLITAIAFVRNYSNFLLGITFSTVVYTIIAAYFTSDSFLCFLPFFFNEQSSSYTYHQGIPSIATLFNFLLISLTGLFKKFRKLIGKTIMIVSSIAFVGYLFNIPFLYFYVEDLSTGMAVHTSILFLHLGLVLIHKNK